MMPKFVWAVALLNIVIVTAAPILPETEMSSTDSKKTNVKESSLLKSVMPAMSAQKISSLSVVPAAPIAAVSPTHAPNSAADSIHPSVIPHVLDAEAMGLQDTDDNNVDQENNNDNLERMEEQRVRWRIAKAEQEEEEAQREREEEEEEIAEKVKADEEQYLQALLSDPRYLEEMNSQKRYDNGQMYRDPSPSDVVLTPRAMAEYLLLTGDLEGVANMINDLVMYGSLTEEEARSYRLAVEAEYDLLAESDRDYVQPIKRDDAYPLDIKRQDSFALDSVDPDVDYSPVVDYERYATPADSEQSSQFYGSADDQFNSPLTNDEEKLQEFLEAILREDGANKGSTDNEGVSLDTADTGVQGSFNDESSRSLEQELESLPGSTGEKIISESDSEKEDEEMSVEDQLKALLPNKSITASKSDNNSKADVTNDSTELKKLAEMAASQKSAAAKDTATLTDTQQKIAEAVKA